MTFSRSHHTVEVFGQNGTRWQLTFCLTKFQRNLNSGAISPRSQVLFITVNVGDYFLTVKISCHYHIKPRG
jgi:hypothetical protein